jgi:K+-sensing histidine kinase KdpD
LFAVVLSVVAMDYYFIPPYRAFSVHAEEVPYVVSFLVGGIIASWLSAARRVAEAGRRSISTNSLNRPPRQSC